MPQQWARAPARVQIQLGKNVTAQPWQMNIDPVIIPVDLLGLEGMLCSVSRKQRAVQFANIAAVEGVNQFLDIGSIDLYQ